MPNPPQMPTRKSSLFLASVRLARDEATEGAFPWTLPIVRAFDRLAFTAPVTFFVGENGSGKSTLLEAIAVACHAVALGGHDLGSDPTIGPARMLGAALIAGRSGKPQSTLFMRAEDVFGYTQRLSREMADLGSTAASFAGTRAYGYVAAQKRALASRYGAEPDARSHGETFLALLAARLVPAGLFFLDEPETPLSPVRVLGLLTMLADACATGSQFVIATHSPILMALPGAALFAFADGAIAPTAWDEVDHVRVTRDFLNAPERYLRHIAGESEPND